MSLTMIIIIVKRGEKMGNKRNLKQTLKNIGDVVGKIYDKIKKGLVVGLFVVGGTVFAIDNAKDAEKIENLQNQIVDVENNNSVEMSKLKGELEMTKQELATVSEVSQLKVELAEMSALLNGYMSNKDISDNNMDMLVQNLSQKINELSKSLNGSNVNVNNIKNELSEIESAVEFLNNELGFYTDVDHGLSSDKEKLDFDKTLANHFGMNGDGFKTIQVELYRSQGANENDSSDDQHFIRLFATEWDTMSNGKADNVYHNIWVEYDRSDVNVNKLLGAFSDRALLVTLNGNIENVKANPKLLNQYNSYTNYIYEAIEEIVLNHSIEHSVYTIENSSDLSKAVQYKVQYGQDGELLKGFDFAKYHDIQVVGVSNVLHDTMTNEHVFDVDTLQDGKLYRTRVVVQGENLTDEQVFEIFKSGSNFTLEKVNVPKHFADLTRSYSVSLDKLDAEFGK